jgi:predicted Zn-dependent protease
MAAPGGHVVVFTGLVHATESAEELAGVLAHEMQHVLLRHTLRAMVRGLGVRATLSVLLGGAGELGNVTGALIEQWGGLRFSRSQESDADLAGVTLLQAAGIDPHGMVTFFEHLAQRGGEPPAFLSTHPASAARAKAILDRIAGSPSVPALPYAWDWPPKP